MTLLERQPLCPFTLTPSLRASRQGRLRNTRELVIDGIPFIIVYREHASTNCIEILRVLHDAQQWPIAD